MLLAIVFLNLLSPDRDAESKHHKLLSEGATCMPLLYSTQVHKRKPEYRSIHPPHEQGCTCISQKTYISYHQTHRTGISPNFCKFLKDLEMLFLYNSIKV